LAISINTDVVIKTSHEGFQKENRSTTLLGFSLTLNLSENVTMFVDLLKAEHGDSKKDLINFTEQAKVYGLGIAVLPSVVRNLGGVISTQVSGAQLKVSLAIPIQ
jgi:hypothetical protein